MVMRRAQEVPLSATRRLAAAPREVEQSAQLAVVGIEDQVLVLEDQPRMIERASVAGKWNAEPARGNEMENRPLVAIEGVTAEERCQ
ncbi:MAG TPA: hypothetical protein VHR17_07415 [Thermoanaerobaculia bacterium]|jgi:hypothetical protein|nr:hypothetical protein [Thermoanaerobaculia bacterium]